MNLTIKSWLYYLLFAFIGFFIYKFQIEKSFNLLTIYLLCVSFSFAGFVLKLDSRKTLPVLFVCALFAMYGVDNKVGIYYLQLQQFATLLAVFAILLFVLLAPYKLLLKKLTLVLVAIILATIYLLKGESLADFKYIPFVAGSFFMFRSISFLHEIKFMKKKVPLIDNINYFLLPSNFSMPLFPIVDYKAFVSSYEGISLNTLQRSSLFICRGMFQMMLYRFIYHEIIVPFEEIHTASQVLIFLMANFLIVLRVIGAFHIALGLVILSGYNIPDIFNNIFFSTGFSDLWRRTNIYWRNFIIKVFYYPIYFKIKKWGVYQALFISTFVCFLITWMLHLYQWFWLKGSIPVEVKDLIFWGSFGLLVSVNTIMQQRKLDRSGSRKEASYQILRQAVNGLAVFFTMSVLWSIWTCSGLTYWWTLMLNFRNFNAHEFIVILQITISYILIASAYHYYEKHRERTFVYFKRNMQTISFGLFVFLFPALQVTAMLVWNKSNLLYQTRFLPMISEKLNKADFRAIDNGYYTNLISTNNYCSQVWINDYDIARNWTKYITNKTTRPSFDLMLTENVPFATVKYKGINYTLNKDGLRDIDYPKTRPDSCYRIIILGGSYECGNGMNDGGDFISLVETRLNENYIATVDGRPVHVELINFSSNGYRLIQRLYQYRNNARFWNPNALLLFIHTDYHMRMVNYVNRLVYQEYPIKDEYLKHIVKMTGIKKGDGGPVVRDKLGSYADSLNYYAVDQISQIAHEDSTKLIAVYLPAIRQKTTKRDSTFMENICSRFGYQQIGLNDVFAGQEVASVALSDIDFHPNKKGNELVANKLLENILMHQDYFNIQFTKK